MKSKAIKPKIVYRIFSRKEGYLQCAYSRSYGMEYDFASKDEARNAMFDGSFKDKKLYRVAKYKVTYTLIKEDC